MLIICMFAMLIFGVAAAMCRSMLKSAIFLAAVSTALAIVLFLFNAPWAGVFELSVCAALITAVFISAMGLSDPDRKSPETVKDQRSRFAVLPFILLILGIALVAIVIISGFSVVSTADPSVSTQTFRDVFWNFRQADILGQIIMILAGAFAVVIFFKEGSKKI